MFYLVIVHLPDYKEVIVSYSEKIFDFCIYLAIIISLLRFLYKSKILLSKIKNLKKKDYYDGLRDINAIFQALELSTISDQ